MEEAFATLIWIVVAGAAVVAVVTLALTGRAYAQIGAGDLVRDDDAFDGDDPPQPAAERELELRDLIGARNVLRERAGREPLDVDHELDRRLREAH